MTRSAALDSLVLCLHITRRNWFNACGAGYFVYCDPPYEPLSATSSFNAYKAGGFARPEQQRLKAACERAAGRGARIAVSNSAAPFNLDLYEHADVNIVTAKRAINSNCASRGNADEVEFEIGATECRG